VGDPAHQAGRPAANQVVIVCGSQPFVGQQKLAMGPKEKPSPEAETRRFPKIMRMQQAKIPGNLKKFLAEEFDTPTQSVEQFIQPCIFEKDVCSVLAIAKSSSGMLLNSVGRSIGQEAISFQSLWIPAGDYFLEIAAGGRPPDGRPPFQRQATA